jgi:D-alanyl-D-alanine carboxypeptidase (penicillin-binding protein 5/6)
MTLLLSFEALDKGILDIDEEVCVSERAASMGGSQVFLEANAKYPVKELIKSIVVCSANDSCVAMAEKIAGSEELFVERMNEKAKELGATDTLFSNCTGLPKDPQYSCAKDVAIMLKALLKHEQYYDFGKVWMDKFAHPKGRYTEISTTNKLVRFYEGCDGGKTGFTSEAGFCLAATAKRGNMRIISVVIGEETSANRFEDVRMMFDYAFANYTVSTIVDASEPLRELASVNGGKSDEVSVYAERCAYAFTRKGEKVDITIDKRLNKLKAPIQKGEPVGELVVYQDGVERERMCLVAGEDVKSASVMDRLKKIAKKWNG